MMKNKKSPLFLRFMNKDISVIEILQSFSKSSDAITAELAKEALEDAPDLEGFRIELSDAVNDLIKVGVGEEFKAFVNHYMIDSIEEDIESSNTQLGENVSRIARVKDSDAPWIQGLICYNLCLYIKVFGLGDVKKCRVCGKVFDHKGQYAVYCSDSCKAEGKIKKI